jgi:hypothetical protein
MHLSEGAAKVFSNTTTTTTAIIIPSISSRFFHIQRLIYVSSVDSYSQYSKSHPLLSTTFSIILALALALKVLLPILLLRQAESPYYLFLAWLTLRV